MSIKAEGTENDETIIVATPGTEDDDAITDPPPGDDESEDGEDQGDDEIVAIAIGAEPSPGSEDVDEIDGKPAPAWVKGLRETAKEQAKRVRELEAALKAKETGTPPADAIPDPGVKPTLEGSDYDAEKFEAALLAWSDRKTAAEAKKKEQETAAATAANAWQAKVAAHNEAGTKLKVSDFKDAQDTVAAALSVQQQAILIDGSEKSHLLVYAIGKNPKVLAELAAITNPVRFAFKAAAIEKDIRVATKRKEIPPPERRVSGNTGTTMAVDGNLERLRAEAARTGDFTKVNAYRTAQRAKSQSK
jgi:hypothetical protein